MGFVKAVARAPAMIPDANLKAKFVEPKA